ncbi:hypothetical protein GCM10010297_34440 [Streptomyces malachitofuscus]|nr:hypothetical protein GCM10010297_34440 [Streptomyces malachitofuscus]
MWGCAPETRPSEFGPRFPAGGRIVVAPLSLGERASLEYGKSPGARGGRGSKGTTTDVRSRKSL